MYDNPFLYADGTAKEEDLDRIEQKFHIKIPKEMREHYLAKSVRDMLQTKLGKCGILGASKGGAKDPQNVFTGLWPLDKYLYL